MTAILLRRERGRNNAEIYSSRCYAPPPPLQREVTFQKGGRNDARVRYNNLPNCIVQTLIVLLGNV